MRGSARLALTICLAWTPWAAGALDASGLGIAVAPFREIAPPRTELPDVAGALASRFRARGLGRVVGPEQLQGTPLTEGAQVRGVAERNGVNAVVLGRTTRLGTRLSVDVRLRSGQSGALAATYVAEVPVSEPIGPAIDRLAEQVIVGVLGLAEGEPAAGTPAPPATPAGESPLHHASGDPPATGAPFGLGNLDGEPLSIRSEELEATDREGVRELVFRRNVQVRQGDLALSAQRLEARYRNGATQPERLLAVGGATLRQGDREARCETARYERRTERIVCSGAAQLRQGADRVEGETVIFDLARRQVAVEGGARLWLHAGNGSGDERDLPLATDDPLTVRAERLEALEGEAERRVVLEGAVEVIQGDVTLHAERLEAVYPDGARQPDRLVAIGDVALFQGDREAHCERAIFQQSPRRVDCIGSAELRDGDDRVEGERIALDLDAEIVTVTGRTRLRLDPRRGETVVQ